MATTTTKQLREDIWQAIEASEPLNDEQFHELIRHEAKLIGLTFEEAVDLGRLGKLPDDAIGFGLSLLVAMLPEIHPPSR